jgi:hypothetical protein
MIASTHTQICRNFTGERGFTRFLFFLSKNGAHISCKITINYNLNGKSDENPFELQVPHLQRDPSRVNHLNGKHGDTGFEMFRIKHPTGRVFRSGGPLLYPGLSADVNVQMVGFEGYDS